MKIYQQGQTRWQTKKATKKRLLSLAIEMEMQAISPTSTITLSSPLSTYLTSLSVFSLMLPISRATTPLAKTQRTLCLPALMLINQQMPPATCPRSTRRTLRSLTTASLRSPKGSKPSPLDRMQSRKRRRRRARSRQRTRAED